MGPVARRGAAGGAGAWGAPGGLAGGVGTGGLDPPHDEAAGGVGVGEVAPPNDEAAAGAGDGVPPHDEAGGVPGDELPPHDEAGGVLGDAHDEVGLGDAAAAVGGGVQLAVGAVSEAGPQLEWSLDGAQAEADGASSGGAGGSAGLAKCAAELWGGTPEAPLACDGLDGDALRRSIL